MIIIESPIILNWFLDCEEGDKKKMEGNSIIVNGRRVCNLDESAVNSKIVTMWLNFFELIKLVNN